MKMSSSIELVKQLAGQEAASAHFSGILPDHILAGILKLSELPVEEIAKMAPGSGVARELTEEVRAIREELGARSIDSKRTRRKLRAELGRGNASAARGRLHRSAAAREVFKTAEKLARDAGSDTLMAQHLLAALLASPTPAMVKVLGDALKKRVALRGGTPLLDRHGTDLTKMAAEGKLPAVRGRTAECKALLRILSESRYPGVLLVSDDDEVGLEVAAAAAHALSQGDVPAGLKDKRIIDVTAAGRRGKGVSQDIDRLGQLLAEGAAADVILFVPPLGSGGGHEGDDWNRTLKGALEGGQARCICRVSPAAYVGGIRKDPEWKRLAHAMWIGEAIESRLPREL